MTSVRRVFPILLSGLLLTLIPWGSSLPTTAYIEGESGIAVVDGCTTDGEVMVPYPDFMFFPGIGCTATYAAQSATGVAVQSARLRVGGMNEVCGYLVLTGAVNGASDPFCLAAGVWTDVAVTAAGHAGAFSVTWVPHPSPQWTNLDLDRLAVLALA